MNTGLLDACNLAWKLALVSQGRAQDALIDSYQAERVPVATSVLALTHTLVRTFSAASPRRRWLRDRVLPPVMALRPVERRYTARLAQLSHDYRGRSLTGRGGLAPGDRLPHVSGLEAGGRAVSTLDLISSSSHTLLVLTGERVQPDAVANARRQMLRFRDIVQTICIDARPALGDGTVTDAALRAHRRYHARRGRLLLIRPDGHLACSAPLDRPDIPAQHMQHLLGQPRDGRPGASRWVSRTR